MKLATIMIAILMISLTGCSKDYSGDYLNLVKHKQVFYQDENGKLRDPRNTMSMMSGLYGVLGGKKPNYKKVYKYETSKVILSLKQDGSTVTGKLTFTNDRKLTEFLIKSGYIDENNLLHLKLIYQPEVAGGISASIFSLSGPIGEIQLIFDQIETKDENLLSFNASGTVNVLGGFGSDKSKNETISFTKIINKNYKKIADKYLSIYIEREVEKLKDYIGNKDYAMATVHRDLIVSLGGNIPSDLKNQLNDLNTASSNKVVN